MNQDIERASAGFRERVAVFLAFLTSEDCLASCRRFLSPEQLAAALSRLWFDEIYVPGDSYLDGLKADRAEEAVRRFEACFSAEQRATLERFHGCFELRLGMAVNRAGGRAAFPENDSWYSLRRDAARLLDDLEPDADQLRGLVAGLVREAAAREDGGLLLDALRGRRGRLIEGGEDGE